MIERLATFAMGTRFELVLGEGGADPPRLRSIGEAALAEIEDLDRRWSLFRRDTLVSFINANAFERPVRLDADTFRLLSIAEEVRRDSGGLFDVTVGAAMHAWGFREEFTTESQSAQKKARAGPTGGGLEDKPDRMPSLCPLWLCGETSSVRFTQPGVALDLGGIAKGYAIDAALAILRENGVTRALLHGGTSCIGAIGSPPDQHAWHVAVERGGPVVALRDSCMAVSSPTGREVQTPAGRIGHIFDPRSGKPAACAQLATVTGPSATLCDAWAKPALIEGRRPGGLPDMYSVHLCTGPRDKVESAKWKVESGNGSASHGIGRRIYGAFA